MDSIAFVAAMKKADTAQNTAHKHCASAAAVLFKDYNAEKGEKDEYPRLMKIGADALKKANVSLKHDRNVRMFVGQHLLAMMAPAQIVEVQKGKAKVLIKASEANTARDLAAAAKQIRDAVGLSDARVNNAPPKKRGNKKASVPTDIGESIRKLAESNLQALRDILKPLGIRVVKSAK